MPIETGFNLLDNYQQVLGGVVVRVYDSQAKGSRVSLGVSLKFFTKFKTTDHGECMVNLGCFTVEYPR